MVLRQFAHPFPDFYRGKKFKIRPRFLTVSVSGLYFETVQHLKSPSILLSNDDGPITTTQIWYSSGRATSEIIRVKRHRPKNWPSQIDESL